MEKKSLLRLAIKMQEPMLFSIAVQVLIIGISFTLWGHEHPYICTRC